MWLEMWAYVSDVLAFYDERIANETYLRTARLRPSLRRLVELLGFIPKPGVAGSVSLALIAEGRVQVVLGPGVGFRSDAFGNEPPQVFELTSDATIHPLQNEWSIGPIQNGSIPEITPSLAEHPEEGIASPPTGTPILLPLTPFSPSSLTQFFTFDTQNFGLARDRLALFLDRTNPGKALGVSTVKQVNPFEGKDGRTYVEVELEPGIAIAPSTDPTTVKVVTTTVSAVPTKNTPQEDPLAGPVRSKDNHTVVYLDAIYRQLRSSDFFIVGHEASDLLEIAVAQNVVENLVDIPGSGTPPTSLPVTRVQLDRDLRNLGINQPPADELTFHFALVDAGTVTTVASTEIAPADLTSAQGVPITGNVQTPPAAQQVNSHRELSQKFLLGDARDQGALVDGVMKFFQTGRAAFRVTNAGDTSLPTFTTPVEVFGNVVEATRGETVFNEVLGSGDPRVSNQQFQLARRPLTYLNDTTVLIGFSSTLHVFVSAVEWAEVRTFFNAGPQDQVFIVRHDDQQNTIITFGDGVRGARLPSGVDNVVATYRVGAGKAAPPAGSITQIARPADGLRSVLSPVAAEEGRDPDSEEDLRKNAVQQMLLLGRAVSVADFEALANQSKGIVKAVAEFLWLDEEQQAGVKVTFIGSSTEADLLDRLRKQADPTLPILVKHATALPRTLQITVGVDPKFKKDDVATAVNLALSSAPDGILAIENASIGGQLWVSQIYEVVHSVKGVVSVESAVMYTEFGFPITLALTDVICAAASSYFDFDEGRRVFVTPVDPSGTVIEPRPTGGP
jgi:hypothetical protein